jgi:porphobilinogen deaminase
VTPEYFAVILARAAMERYYVLTRVPRELMEEDIIPKHDAAIRDSLCATYGGNSKDWSVYTNITNVTAIVYMCVLISYHCIYICVD